MAIKRRKTKRKTASSGGGKTRSKGRATAMKRVSRPAKRAVRKSGMIAGGPSPRPGGKRP